MRIRGIFDRNFVIFVVVLGVAIVAFLVRESPQYAPFSTESSVISKSQQTLMGGGAK